MTTNAEKASALVANVRSLKPTDAVPENKLGLKFFEEEDGTPVLTLHDYTHKVRAEYLLKVLDRVNWNVIHASALLKCARITLYRLIKRYNLKGLKQVGSP